jgi:organic radical activating enzyme
VEAINETYYLSEYFSSIQGEGNYAGVLSLFLRFHFCNLTCSWCDSKYTWNLKSGKYQTLLQNDIKTIISKSTNHHIIFTGGEPSLYSLDKLVVPGKKYHVESNGTIIPTEPLQLIFGDRHTISRAAMDENIIKTFNWVISPKLSNSRQMLNKQSLRFWAEKEYSVFKFIIRNRADLDEINDTIQQFAIDRKKVYIALEGQTLESQIKPELVDSIMEQGYNFSPRLHVMLWGAKRGK